MLKVGITGGMGSGKTTVTRIFHLLGIPVYYADERSKILLDTDAILRKKVVEIFGNQSYVNDTLNKTFISSQVFNNPEKLKVLNSLVHPVVIADGERWMQAQNSPYALKEAALIFESGSDRYLDLVIGVWCPIEVRIARIMRRDKSNRQEILARISKQMDEEEKLGKCDYIIKNDEANAVIPQVLDLHSLLLGKSEVFQVQ